MSCRIMREESMKRPLSISLPLVFLISFTFCFILGVNTVFGEKFIPPVPDKSKTLSANDGGSDGCDSSRFKCLMGGEAVLDKQTGLVWARNASYDKKAITWQDAVEFSKDTDIGGKTGWRLPDRDEFITLLDTSQSNPALPEGHPFILSGVKQQGGAGTSNFWTSTEYGSDKESVWVIEIKVGRVRDDLKVFDAKVWLVRDAE